MPGRNYTLQDLFANIAGSINANVDTSTQFEVVDNFVNDSEILILNESASPPSFTTSTNYPVLIGAEYPIAYWRLAESAGGVAFDSNQGLYSIYPRINSSSMTGVTQGAGSFLSHSKAAQFTASTSAIVFPNGSSIQITGDLTVEFWAFFTSFSTSGTAYGLVTKDGASFGTGEYGVYLFNNSGTGQIRYAQNGGMATLTAGSLSLNTWYHVAVVRDGTAKTVTIYINGTSAGSGSYATAPTGTTNSVVLGNNSTSAVAATPMSLTEVALYAKPLSSSQASSHHSWGAATDALATAYGGLSSLYGTFPYPSLTHPTTTSYGAALWGTATWK
jgi:hypothetical protein